MSAYALMANGMFYGMSAEQEAAARREGLRTIQQDNGSWAWTASIGEDWGFATEEEAWADGIQALDDKEMIDAPGSAFI